MEKKIREIQDLVENLSDLNYEIKDVEELLKNIVTDRVDNVEFSYKVRKEDGKKNVLDSEGNIKPEYLECIEELNSSLSSTFTFAFSPTSVLDHDPKLFLYLSEDLQIKVLSLILSEKKGEKSKILKKLKRRGFKI